MKSILSFSFVVTLLLGCNSEAVSPESNDDKLTSFACGKENPVNEYDWLKDLINRRTQNSSGGTPSRFRIVAYKYKEKQVIEDEMPFHSSPYIHVYNCDGTQALSVQEYNIFLQERTLVKVLYEFKP